MQFDQYYQLKSNPTNLSVTQPTQIQLELREMRFELELNTSN